MKKVRIGQTLRLLEKVGRGNLLRLNGGHLASGTEITIEGPAENCSYQNRDFQVIPFIWEGKQFYILESDINSHAREI